LKSNESWKGHLIIITREEFDQIILDTEKRIGDKCPDWKKEEIWQLVTHGQFDYDAVVQKMAIFAGHTLTRQKHETN
jgi:hypothetical protein